MARLIPLGLAGLVALLYAGSYGYPLVFDDAALANQVFAEAGREPALRPRWLSSMSFWWTTATAGMDVPLLRAQNVLLHAAAAAAVFYLCRMLIETAAPARANAVAAVAAAGFALHPVAVYGVAYLAQRSIVMATLFSVLCLVAWLRGRFEASGPWLAASVAFFALAVLSKEHAIMLPAVAVAATLAMRHRVRGSNLQFFAALAAMALVALWTIWSVRAVVGEVYEEHAAQALAAGPAGADAHLQLRSWATQTGLFFRYVATWLVPLPQWMSIDVRVDLVASFVPAIAGVLAFAAFGLAGLWFVIAPGGRELLGLAMLAPWLFYFTEFASIRMQEPFALYRSYLWGIGFPIMLAWSLATAGRRTFIVMALATCIGLGFGMRERLATFATPLALWEDAVVRLGGERPFMSERALGNYGTALLEAGRLTDAVEHLQLALAVNPASAPVLSTLASARVAVGDFVRAEADYDRAIAARPKFAEALAARCGLRIVRRDLAAARTDCERSIEIAPKTALAHLNLGVVHVYQGNLRGALAEFETAARLAPKDPVARHNAAFARAALERRLRMN